MMAEVRTVGDSRCWLKSDTADGLLFFTSNEQQVAQQLAQQVAQLSVNRRTMNAILSYRISHINCIEIAAFVCVQRCIDQGCSLGLERLGLEAVSRRFLEHLGLVSVLKI